MELLGWGLTIAAVVAVGAGSIAVWRRHTGSNDASPAYRRPLLVALGGMGGLVAGGLLIGGDAGVAVSLAGVACLYFVSFAAFARTMLRRFEIR